jgi:hypothetical protein
MKNQGLFSSLFIEDVREKVELDDVARGRLATLKQTWSTRNSKDAETLWNSFIKQALGYLKFVLPSSPSSPGVYPLYDDYSYAAPIAVIYLCPPDANLDDVSIGRFWPGRLVAELRKHKINWGVLSDGARWRLYSLKTAKPYEDFVELDLAAALAESDEPEYALFEKFFHRDCFVAKTESEDDSDRSQRAWKEAKELGVYRCELDECRTQSDEILEERVKSPLLAQVDEVLQYLCNGFIADTPRKGADYTEEERRAIFESAVKLLYRCLFLFYAEARSLLPSDPEKRETYERLSIMHLCAEARKFRWGQRKDNDGFDLWKHLKGLANAVNEGDPQYGIMGYNGGLFDDEEEKFLGKHKLRNDFLSRALYLLAYVEPLGNEQEDEYPIPYADLEVRHLGELYENILEFNVTLADADRIRRRAKKGIQIMLASETKFDPKTDSRIRKGDVYFGETALERKQSGSYYTPETLVHFLNQKAIITPIREKFDKDCRSRFSVFCKEAASSRDVSIRRGAAQSAIVLVERFAEDVVLKFRACDPAMGSGHFLVNGANQITDLIVEFLAEVPGVEGLKSRISCSPNHWRRLVTRHCLYGVDLNRLAVHLAKLSLWLNCFARDHKLTFLDHHVKTGNSLIGVRHLSQLEKLPERAKTKIKPSDQALLFPADLKKACSRVVSEIEKIGRIGEDDTDRMKALHEQATDETRSIAPLADLYTAYLMDHTIGEDDYCEIFTDIAHGRKPNGILAKDILGMVAVLASRHHFFHWTLAFPEVFGGDESGFDAVVGNPPWDIVKPNSQEFFLEYDPGFRDYGKQEAVKISKRLMEEHETIRRKWAVYSISFEEQSLYVHQPDAYKAIGNGDINTFKLFAEQFFAIAGKGGRLGIIVPSGLHTDQGCLPLRNLLFSQSRIEALYGFENRRGVFNIHRSFKFDLLCAQKGGRSDAFKCAFMEQNPEHLTAIDAAAFEMNLSQIKRFSPESLSIMEIKNQRELELTQLLCDSGSSLSAYTAAGWEVNFTGEFHMTGDSNLFRSTNTGFPLYEGKMIWQFDHVFETPRYWLNDDEASEALGSNVWMSKSFRILFRDVASSTNERTMIAAVVPPCYFGHTISSLAPAKQQGPEYFASTLFLTGVLNSFCCDFLLRQKITSHLSFFYVSSLPIPITSRDDECFRQLVAKVLRLTSVSQDFAPLWKELFAPEWRSSAFWYPKAGLSDYGPEHEQIVRKRLADQSMELTSKWTPKCGVHERMPDRRDTGDRLQLRAEIDAYVAHLYGLSRDDFEYVLGTFPVLERKETKAFGEFVSKRKCLEEYDRIAQVLKKQERGKS